MGKKKGKKGLKADKPKGNQIRASHILVEKLGQAQEVIEELEAGVSFQKLASQYSNCPSKKRGGDLGIFGKGQMVPEFERAAYALKVGEISKPIKTSHGYHVIKRTG